MSKIYCPSCGSPTDYTTVKPEICPECEKPYIGSISATVNSPNLAVKVNTTTRTLKKPSIKSNANLNKPSRLSRPSIKQDNGEITPDDDYEGDETETLRAGPIPELDGSAFRIEGELQDARKKRNSFESVVSSGIGMEKPSPLKQRLKVKKKFTKKIRDNFIEEFKKEAGHYSTKNNSQEIR